MDYVLVQPIDRFRCSTSHSANMLPKLLLPGRSVFSVPSPSLCRSLARPLAVPPAFPSTNILLSGRSRTVGSRRLPPCSERMAASSSPGLAVGGPPRLLGERRVGVRGWCGLRGLEGWELDNDRGVVCAEGGGRKR